MKNPPLEATCAACMKRKACTTTTHDQYGFYSKTRDNFKYSPEHKGFICKRCCNRLESLGA